jgi:hypothetical protein
VANCASVDNSWEGVSGQWWGMGDACSEHGHAQSASQKQPGTVVPANITLQGIYIRALNGSRPKKTAKIAAAMTLSPVLCGTLA